MLGDGRVMLFGHGLHELDVVFGDVVADHDVRHVFAAFHQKLHHEVYIHLAVFQPRARRLGLLHAVARV